MFINSLYKVILLRLFFIIEESCLFEIYLIEKHPNETKNENIFFRDCKLNCQVSKVTVPRESKI